MLVLGGRGCSSKALTWEDGTFSGNPMPPTPPSVDAPPSASTAMAAAESFACECKRERPQGLSEDYSVCIGGSGFMSLRVRSKDAHLRG